MALGSPPSSTSRASTSRAASRLTSLAETIAASAASASGETFDCAGSASDPIRSTSWGIQLAIATGSLASPPSTAASAALEVVGQLGPEGQLAGSVGAQAELALEALGAGGRELGQRGAARATSISSVGHDRDEVGLREVAVVVGLLLGAQRRQRARAGVEVERLLDDRLPGLEQRDLALDLRPHAALEEAERVHVLELGLGPQLGRPGRPDRHVGVAAQRALRHVDVGDAEPPERRAQQRQPLAGLLGRVDVRLGDDLDQRRAAAVEVDPAALRAVDPAALARGG